MAGTDSQLLIEEGPGRGQVIELRAGNTVIGREEGVDYQIQAPAVSRRHASLHTSPSGVMLQDLGSSNGTYLNGNRITGQPVKLKSGDRISLGKSITLLFTEPVNESAAATRLEPKVAAPAGVDAQTVIGDVASLTPPAAPPQLEITIAGQKPVRFTLNQPCYHLGRSTENEIVVSSPVVSRHHAVIEKTPSGYQLRVESEVTNPILREGRPVAATVDLRHNDLLRIGGSDPGMLVTLRYLAPHESSAAHQLKFDFGQTDRATIGRDPSNDVFLDSPLVSRFHAQIERVGQRFRLVDLRSANGTFVNDQRVEGNIWLQPQDTIRIGPYRFVLAENSMAQFDESGGLRVEVIGLNKWVRKDLNLLKDISLICQPREFIVVVGQSGGGKSTLVDAIAGYRPATAGKVLVNGIDAYRNFDAIRNEIGFVPQKDIIHMELTVYQALDYAAQLRMPPDTTRAERHKRVMEVLDDLDLTHRKDLQVSGLSGGQQKRVSIGVELLTSPGLFFLDEPTSGLDPGTETALMQLMRRLSDRGRTILLVTHATKNVMLADKVIFLARGGYLAWFGPPDEALTYFDQYRSERDRRARPIEFDEIYAILDDSSKGKGEDWAKRYQEHAAYQKYIIRPLAERGHQVEASGRKVIGPATPAPEVKRERKKRGKVSGLRQFLILSARNARILTRDKPALFLMLAVSPIISLLEVVLSFVLGADLFNYVDGNMASIVTSMFMPIVYAVMVGALAQMREFVKESEIYKRERLVNLQVLPYVLSKVWVAGFLALYQALVYIGVHYLVFKMPGGTTEFLLSYLTLYLATFSGMMLGLASSALAPNANAAPLIVIMLLMPQLTLGGALISVPDYISGPTSARWAFEALMAISGPGSDIAADACWELPEELRDNMSLEDKAANGCRCLGLAALREDSCRFPGVGQFYDPVLDQPEPVEPEELGPQPSEPVIPPAPPEPGKDASNVEMTEYLLALQDYQDEVKVIQDNYKAEMEQYQARADIYKEQMTQYQKDLSEWKIKRNSAVGEAEGLIKTFYNEFAWTYVDKNNTEAYWGKLVNTWKMQVIIIGVLTVIAIVLIWRKDKVR